MFVVQNVVDIQSFLALDLDVRKISRRSFQKGLLLVRHDKNIFNLKSFQDVKDVSGLESFEGKVLEKDQFASLHFSVRAARRAARLIFSGRERM